MSIARILLSLASQPSAIAGIEDPKMLVLHIDSLSFKGKTALGKAYMVYTTALKYLNIKTVAERRHDLCLNFSKKAVTSTRTCLL